MPPKKSVPKKEVCKECVEIKGKLKKEEAKRKTLETDLDKSKKTNESLQKKVSTLQSDKSTIAQLKRKLDIHEKSSKEKDAKIKQLESNVGNKRSQFQAPKPSSGRAQSSPRKGSGKGQMHSKTKQEEKKSRPVKEAENDQKAPQTRKDILQIIYKMLQENIGNGEIHLDEQIEKQCLQNIEELIKCEGKLGSESSDGGDALTCGHKNPLSGQVSEIATQTEDITDKGQNKNNQEPRDIHKECAVHLERQLSTQKEVYEKERMEQIEKIKHEMAQQIEKAKTSQSEKERENNKLHTILKENENKIDKLSKKAKDDDEMIGGLETHLEQLETELRIYEGPVSVVLVKGQGEYESAATDLINALAKRLEKNRIELVTRDFTESDLDHELSSVLVFGLNTSRLGTDVDAAYNKSVSEGLQYKKSVLIIMHHKPKHNTRVTPSEEILESWTRHKHKIDLIVDCVFWSSDGLHKCETNDEAVGKLALYLRKEKIK